MKLLTCKKIFTALLLISTQLFVAAQDNDVLFNSADGLFTVQISRTASEVVISTLFHKKITCDYVSIERKGPMDTAFQHCKYIAKLDMEDSEGKIVRHDWYPTSAGSDVQYRVKIVSPAGQTKIYPIMRLLGLSTLLATALAI
jgi:hypothetical protein